ncbi:metalloregulator ArsR/SmtB family transcription factor [Breoghania sp.]|uniref:ArsR/SmtB family transcription factor n=1 Tax=Breoghania sp. TaxID=2065378 RepID=UPI002AA9208C|nr:metalloregulator ArsR/SmtB family transcription factor [Breoghania sp.]
MPDFDDDRLAACFKALGHPARLAILRALADEERCCCGDIVGRLPLAQSTVSQHLQILRDAGLIRGEAEGRKSRYCLDRAAFLALGEGTTALLDAITDPNSAMTCCTNEKEAAR